MDRPLETNTKFAKTRRCNYYENLKPKIVALPRPETGDLPDIFVYLKVSADNVCYARLRPEDYQDLHAKPKWIQLFPDKAKGMVSNDWEGGFVRIRLYVGLMANRPDTTIGGWD